MKKISFSVLSLLSLSVLATGCASAGRTVASSRATPPEALPFHQCYSRIYSGTHLRMNPRQKISTLQIEIHDSSEFPGELYSIITVHDRESGLDFKAAGTGKKEILRNGRLAQAGSFRVDSDVGEGGSFTLSPREDGSVLLLVKEHLTLLDEVSYEGEVIIPEDARTLTLNGTDKDNTVFKAMSTQCDD